MTPKLLHRDLKPKNLLLTNRYHILKVCDFGTVRSLETNMTSDIGTAAYMAPEVVIGKSDGNPRLMKYDEKCDVYSFGIILWEIMTRKMPYSHLEGYRYLTILYKTVLEG